MIMTTRSNGRRNLVPGDVFVFEKNRPLATNNDVTMHLVLAVRKKWDFNELYEVVTYTEGASFSTYTSVALVPMFSVRLLIEAEQSTVQASAA